MRRYEFDNLRIICIFLLFPFHTAMIFNNHGEMWYVLSEKCIAASFLNFSLYPWWMSGLFVIAGISTHYATQKQSVARFMKARFLRLFVPCVLGTLLFVPVQTYLADIFWNGYQGSYIGHYKTFLSLTDWSGYDGHFSPAHLWFILYLFIISLVCVPLIIWKKRTGTHAWLKLTGLPLLLVGLIPSLTAPLIDIGGKSFSENLAWFIIGYLILSDDDVQEWVRCRWLIWTVIAAALTISRCIVYALHVHSRLFWDCSTVCFRWIGILALLGCGLRFLKKQTAFTRHFAPASFPLYVYHQQFVVIAGFIFVRTALPAGMQYIAILVTSFVLTLLTYEATRIAKNMLPSGRICLQETVRARQ